MAAPTGETPKIIPIDTAWRNALAGMTKKEPQNLQKLPETLGESADQAVALIQGPRRPGGVILNKIGTSFFGGAKRIGKSSPIFHLTLGAVCIAAIPGAIVGGGLGILGGIFGAIAGAIKGGKSTEWGKKGGNIGFKVGYGLVMFLADVPVMIPKIIAAGLIGSIGAGFLKLSGASQDEIKQQCKDLADITFKLEEALFAMLTSSQEPEKTEESSEETAKTEELSGEPEKPKQTENESGTGVDDVD